MLSDKSQAASNPAACNPAEGIAGLAALADLLGSADLDAEETPATLCAAAVERALGWKCRVEESGQAVATEPLIQSDTGVARALLPFGRDGEATGLLVIEAVPVGPDTVSSLHAVMRLCGQAISRANQGRRSRRDQEAIGRLQSSCGEVLESNRRLRELGHRKDDFLAICAKDLRAPLNVLLGQTRLLLNGARGTLSEAQRESLLAIERQGQRLAQLSQEFLDMSALETSRLDLRREPTDLALLCSEVAGAYASMAQDKRISLTRSLPAFPLVIPLDKGKIREALATLLSTAILLAPEGGQVELALKSLSEGGRIEISSMGAPSRGGARRGGRISDAADPGPELSTGWGLGLPICRELVELHSGSLEVSALSGGGRRVEVTLPLLPRPTESVPADRDRVGGSETQILVAEDEAGIREALTALLEADYTVTAVSDGQAAVEVARNRPPDLILMDLFMPRMDGFAAIESLRTDPRTAEIPVIFVSARGDDVTKVRSLDLGAVDFLQKPFSERELKARIERTLRLTRRQSQLRELAQTDPLTGLANLRAFRARIEEEVKRARRYLTPLTCVMADMDRLKPLNDQYGHAAGDRAIALVAEVIRGELRGTDFGARYGGDEFVVLLPHTTKAEGKVFAERVCARLCETALQVNELRIPLVASFGVAELPAGAPEDVGAILVAQADEALYAAKRAGRNQIVSLAANASERPAATIDGRLRRDAQDRLRRSA